MFYLKSIFYKLKWIDNRNGDDSSNEYGYYIVKRKWVWLLFSPLIIIGASVIHFVRIAYEVYASVNSYESAWVQTGKDEKMTLKEYREIFDRLA